MSRQDKVIWTFTIEDKTVRAQRGSGGEISATGHKGWNGGAGETERGGRKTTSNITLAGENNGDPSIPWLQTRINKAITVHRTPADDDDNPRLAEQVAYNGRLLNVRFDDSDTMNEGDIEFWEIEVGVDT